MLTYTHRWMFAAILTLCGTLNVNAQVNLTGRSYENPNIMADQLDKAFKDADHKFDSLRTAKIAELEQKKGRKINAKEQAAIDKVIKEGRDVTIAIKKGMKVAIGVDFISTTEAVMRTKITIDEEELKAAGVSWIKRKAVKAAMGVMPESEKGKYHITGNLIIMEDPKEPDTLRLSDDGKHIYGKFDKKTKFTLTRTK